jgi:hypothetical protein
VRPPGIGGVRRSSAEGVLTGVAERILLACRSCGPSTSGICLRDVEEAVLVLVLLVDGGHERSGRREDLVDEDEDGLLGRELDALADHVDELAHGEIGGDQVLLLIDGRDVRLLDLLADDLYGRETSARMSGSIDGRCDGCRRG